MPSIGPASGNTYVVAHGHNLGTGDNYKCRFGDARKGRAIVVNARLRDDRASLECYTPQYIAKQGDEVVTVHGTFRVPFAISLNNQQFTEEGVEFIFGPPAAISKILPNAGPRTGGTKVTIYGSNFAGGDDYRCKFGETKVKAELEGARAFGYHLVCNAPALNTTQMGEVLVPLEVSINDQQFTGDQVDFRYFADVQLRALNPTSGPVDGDTEVLVHFTEVGSVPGTDTTFYCKFGYRITVGALVAAETIACPSPAVTAVTHVQSSSTGKAHYSDADTKVAQVAMVSVSTNGQQYTNVKPFQYYAAPMIAEISPQSGPVHGKTNVTIVGANLGNGSNLKCRFGATPPMLSTAYYVSPAVDDGEGTLWCVSTVGFAGGTSVSLEVSLNAQQYTKTTALYQGDALVEEIRKEYADGTGGFADGIGGQETPGGIVTQAYTWPVVAAPGGVAVNTYHYYVDPFIDALSPNTGPVVGATTINVTGSDVAGGSHYVCKLSHIVDGARVERRYPATYVAGGEVRCVSPAVPLDAEGPHDFQLALNGQQFTLLDNSGVWRGEAFSSAVTFGYYADPAVVTFSPASGPIQGDTFVTISGVHFGRSLQRDRLRPALPLWRHRGVLDPRRRRLHPLPDAAAGLVRRRDCRAGEL